MDHRERHVTRSRDRVLQKFVRKYSWIHLGLGLTGNILFVIGSSLMLAERTRQLAIWFFLAGSIGMLLGRLGEGIARGLDGHWQRLEAARQHGQ